MTLFRTKTTQQHPDSVKKRAGFSLVEIAIVLAVISIMLAGLLPFITESQKSSKTDATAARMEQVRQALLAYYQENGNTLPCPASASVSVSSSDFGVAATFVAEQPGPPVVPATCIDGDARDPFAETDSTLTGVPGAAIGTVPVKTLGLPDETAFDGWQRRFTYTVSLSTVEAGNAGELIVEDGLGTERADDAAFVLLSHGPNGHGGHLLGGSRYDARSINTHEQENCDCDNSAAMTTGASGLDGRGHIFIQKIHSGDNTNRFDDVLTWMTTDAMDIALIDGGSAPEANLNEPCTNIGDTAIGSQGVTLVCKDGTNPIPGESCSWTNIGAVSYETDGATLECRT